MLTKLLPLMVNEGSCKEREVILQDLSITLYFVFCNTKALTAREKHLAQGHRSVGGHMMFNALEEFNGTCDSKWLIPHCGCASQILLFLSSLWSKDYCICLKIKANGSWFSNFHLILSFIVYISFYAWKENKGSNEYGFKRSLRVTNPEVWLTRKEYMRQLRFPVL